MVNASDDSAVGKPWLEVESDMVTSGDAEGSGIEVDMGSVFRTRDEPKAASACTGSCMRFSESDPRKRVEG